jgi:hypothetical protein
VRAGLPFFRSALALLPHKGVFFALVSSVLAGRSSGTGNVRKFVGGKRTWKALYEKALELAGSYHMFPAVGSSSPLLMARNGLIRSVTSCVDETLFPEMAL